MRRREPPDQRWAGVVHIAIGHALYVGPGGDTQRHRHHALQLTLALDHSFEVEIESAGPERRACVLLGADTAHRISGGGSSMALYYVDRESIEGRSLTACLEGRPAKSFDSHAGAFRAAVRDALDRRAPESLTILRACVSEVTGVPVEEPPEVEPLVDRARRLLEDSAGHSMSVPELARQIGLSQRELSARFRSETGLSIRRYRLWLRLNAAVRALARETTLTHAAHAAGFADAAHLSRTFVQMFGVPPSASVGASTIEASDGS